ncbi:Dihydroorotase [Lactobacillus helveticus DPC 4571]|uniref:Dihydroorotase n=2 Tax=Lactobacillus helveticus TaxID=1587 RepID=PYRC_LACH4|nr:dihydroorotase [Lactobacillus helveticus]A8YVZ5.1 RecName: Full=Dihydroorotase; Short=DHOase [Lactobacillus helveticus DPC 4571]ABX27424.1 Dihydroorotase [Lactobacillus helveticus DPC 4571]MDY0990778.1 dihydroorotase [Lactobacillus helveticus]MDY1001458.1 dihydroorotase [Lactobacillus helveticus]MEB2873299.1 dihydroorotase [Lactobacillus helveticus]NRO49048.1 Dihydroorotase [Lactobacillus helveticus]
MQTVIKNGTVYQNGRLIHADVLIEDQKIKAIGTDLTGDKVIDATGKLVSPGLVDVHVHYRDPGQTYKEDIETGSKAAAHGGFTTVGAMPNVTPVPDTPDLMKKMVQENKQKGIVHIFQYGPITKNETTDELPDYAALKKAGAFALSNDGHGVQTAQTMYLAMQEAKKNDLIVAAHAQDDSLFNHGIVNEGEKAKELNLPPVTELAETTQIARDLLLAEKTGVHYHICHVSTKTSVELVRMAKACGINVTCEAAPHHLLLTEDDIPKDNGYYKMNPPLRSKEDQAALLVGLLDGTIDLIATDHAPHAKQEKQGGMQNAAFGITGSETAFSTLYTKFVKEDKVFTLEQLLSWLSDQPAKVFGLKKAGVLEPGCPADVAIFDLEHETELKEKDYQSKGINTPFTGQKIYGATVMTMVDGEVVYQRGEK